MEIEADSDANLEAAGSGLKNPAKPVDSSANLGDSSHREPVSLTGDSLTGDVRRWDLLTLLIPMLAMLPMLVFHWAALWAESEMRFFPAVLLFVVVIVAIRLRAAEPMKFASRLWTAIGLFALSCLIFAYSIWIFSPWLSYLAAVLVFFSWGLGRFGELKWGSVFGVAGCLATTLALPFDWNVAFSRSLQQCATWCCSKALDGLGIPHLWVGQLLELRNLTISVDHVCGGWTSVFTLLGITAILLVAGHRSMFVAILSILAVPVWTMLIFFIRLFSAALVHEHYGRDIATGTDCLLLQMATFLLAMCCSWLLIRVLKTLFEPVPVGDAEFGPLFASMNRLVCWPQPDPFEEIPPEDPDDRKHYMKLKRERQAALDAKPKLEWWENQYAKWTVVVGCVLVAVVALLPCVAIATGAARPRFLAATIPPQSVERLAETKLPDQIEDWKLVFDERGPIFSQQSDRKGAFGWEYRSASQTFFLQVIYPFIGWSNPTDVQTQRGWTINNQELRLNADGDQWPVFEAELVNDLGGRVYLFSSFMDSEFHPYREAPIFSKDGQEAIGGSQRITEIIQGGQRSADKVTLQINLVCESGESLTALEVNDMRTRFEVLRIQFLDVAGLAMPEIPAEDTSEELGGATAADTASP